MTKDSKKIISAGHICLDITPIFPDNRSYKDIASILIPGKLINMDKADVSTGGSVANTGLALKKLGCDVTLLGKVGNDHFGDLIKSIVSSYGAGGLISDDNSSTSYSVVLAVPGIDRVFLHNPGANDTFSSAVYCGNKLKFWKTRPKFKRFCRISFSVRVRSSSASKMIFPFTKICPLVGISKKFRHRSRVVLPPPEAPITAMVCPFSSEKSTPFKTMRSPNLFCRFLTSSIAIVTL